MRTPVIVGATVAAVLFAGIAVAATVGPDTPVTPPVVSTPIQPPGAADPAPNGRPRLVAPRPGMAQVRAVKWESAEPDGTRAVVVTYWSGVEPCNVLDHVTVTYRPDAVRIALHEGSDPKAAEQVCIDIGIQKSVRVALTEPLGNRRVVDGT